MDFTVFITNREQYSIHKIRVYFKYISDHMKRLDGYALLIDAIIYFIGFIICASISIALTVIVYKKIIVTMKVLNS